MENRAEETNLACAPGQPKAYGSPVIRDYGTIRDLTLGNNSQASFDLIGTCAGGLNDTFDCNGGNPGGAKGK